MKTWLLVMMLSSNNAIVHMEEVTKEECYRVYWLMMSQNGMQDGTYFYECVKNPEDE